MAEVSQPSQISFRGMPLDLTGDKSTQIQEMAWRHQFITWANVDPIFCCQMASQSQNEFIC